MRCKRAIFLLLMRAKDRRFPGYYRDFKSREFAPLEQNLQYQRQRLEDILLYAHQHVPYYTKVLQGAGVVSDGIVRLERFDAVPVLTKDIIRSRFDGLHSRELARIRHIRNTSGGSTGEPVLLLQDLDMVTQDQAFVWVQNSFACPYPCRHLRLWGAHRDMRTGLASRLRSYVADMTLLNSFYMPPPVMERYIGRINSIRPELIEAYAQAMTDLAKFIKARGLKVHSPKGIITSATTLDPRAKAMIEEAFGTVVLNRYGSREAPALACSCRQSSQLHANIFTRYIEILDADRRPCAPGQVGEVYVTTLNNYSMPLIRYRIGDLAVPSADTNCPCGRGMPLIESITGRVTNIFRTPGGGLVYGGYFTQLFYYKPWVRQFQVVQEELQRITLNIALQGQPDRKDMSDIEGGIRQAMGPACAVEWNFVDEITPTATGKRLYTISKVR